MNDAKYPEKPSKTELDVKEIRIYGERGLPVLDQLGRLIAAVKQIDFSASSDAQINRVDELMALAQTAFENAAPPDEVNAVYWSLCDCLVVSSIKTKAKAVTH